MTTETVTPNETMFHDDKSVAMDDEDMKRMMKLEEKKNKERERRRVRRREQRKQKKKGATSKKRNMKHRWWPGKQSFRLVEKNPKWWAAKRRGREDFAACVQTDRLGLFYPLSAVAPDFPIKQPPMTQTTKLSILFYHRTLPVLRKNSCTGVPTSNSRPIHHVSLEALRKRPKRQQKDPPHPGNKNNKNQKKTKSKANPSSTLRTYVRLRHTLIALRLHPSNTILNSVMASTCCRPRQRFSM